MLVPELISFPLHLTPGRISVLRGIFVNLTSENNSKNSYGRENLQEIVERKADMPFRFALLISSDTVRLQYLKQSSNSSCRGLEV